MASGVQSAQPKFLFFPSIPARHSDRSALMGFFRPQQPQFAKSASPTPRSKEQPKRKKRLIISSEKSPNALKLLFSPRAAFVPPSAQKR